MNHQSADVSEVALRSFQNKARAKNATGEGGVLLNSSEDVQKL